MRWLTMCGLLAASCSADLTQEFLGDWTLTSGTLSTVCDGRAAPAAHHFGDFTLTVARADDHTLAVDIGFFDMGVKQGTCQLTADVLDDFTAELHAKACVIGTSPYNILSGSLRAYTNHILTLEHSADIPSPTGTCRKTSNATLAPQ